MQEGEILWKPNAARIEQANVTVFARWLERECGLVFGNYMELWRWSVTDLESFWGALWAYFGVEASSSYTRVLGRRAMPGAEWFPGARLNYAQNVLRREREGGVALLHASETRPPEALAWPELAGQVRILATRLRALGVQPGDRVVAWMPNIPQTVIAMLATTAIGAVWACCSPDFGERGTLDRFAQLTPKVLFCIDGYRYGGKPFDRRAELERILVGLPSVQRVIYLPYLDPNAAPPRRDALTWADALDHPAVSAAEFRFEQVPFDHPLWTLFSSGTTGLPKAIVHGHGGILLETQKNAIFHFDLHPGERLLFFTTTGWMLWNFLASTLATGACPILYDGSPAYPVPDTLWKLAQDAKATMLGASPTYVEQMVRLSLV
ncbi:MAG: AMP-binding protein, partial [Steroidobacteraceae bacterium]